MENPTISIGFWPGHRSENLPGCAHTYSVRDPLLVAARVLDHVSHSPNATSIEVRCYKNDVAHFHKIIIDLRKRVNIPINFYAVQ